MTNLEAYEAHAKYQKPEDFEDRTPCQILITRHRLRNEPKARFYEFTAQ